MLHYYGWISWLADMFILLSRQVYLVGYIYNNWNKLQTDLPCSPRRACNFKEPSPNYEMLRCNDTYFPSSITIQQYVFVLVHTYPIAPSDYQCKVCRKLYLARLQNIYVWYQAPFHKIYIYKNIRIWESARLLLKDGQTTNIENSSTMNVGVLLLKTNHSWRQVLIFNFVVNVML